MPDDNWMAEYECRGNPEPTPEPDIDRIENEYGITLPSEYRQVLLAWGPGSFCGIIDIIDPSWRAASRFAGSWLLDRDSADVRLLHSVWSQHDLRIDFRHPGERTPAGESNFFPFCSIEEFIGGWTLTDRKAESIVVFPQVYPQDQMRFAPSLSKFVGLLSSDGQDELPPFLADFDPGTPAFFEPARVRGATAVER